MPSANKDRIRVTLHVDCEIYKMLQRMSKVEQKAISRIFDDALAPIVERYKYPTPEDWEMAVIEARVEKYEKAQEIEIPKLKIDEQIAKISKRISAAKSNEERQDVIQELENLLEQRKNKDEYRNRWIKYCSEEESHK